MSVEKGEAVDVVSFWWPLERPEGWSGHQGQAPPPPPGATLRLFADKTGELLQPNGWQHYDGKALGEAVAESVAETVADAVADTVETVEVEVDAAGEAVEEVIEEVIEEEEVVVTEAAEEEVPVEEETPEAAVIEGKRALFSAPWRKLIQRIKAMASRLRNLFKRPKK